MLFGSNAKKIIEILEDFLKQKGEIIPQKINLNGLVGLQHAVTLRKIANEYIIKCNFDISDIFNRLHDDYNEEGGIEKFLFYVEILQKEKNDGFRNLAMIVKTLEEKKQLITK
jgi:hypothetical protein